MPSKKGQDASVSKPKTSVDLFDEVKKKLANGRTSAEVASNLHRDIRYIPTGSLNFDYLLGGGFQQGRLHEIWGEAEAGKSTFLMHVIALAQKMGHNIGFIDSEFSWTNEYAERHGVDLEKIIVYQEDEITKVINTAVKWLDNGITLIILDSQTVIRSEKELGDDASKMQIAGNSKLLSRLINSVRSRLFRNNATMIAVNQVRANMGSSAMSSFSTWKTEVTPPGGKAWQHGLATSTLFHKKTTKQDFNAKDIPILKGSPKKDKVGSDRFDRGDGTGTIVTGWETDIYAHKNKTAPQTGMHRVITFSKTLGMDVAGDVLDFSREFGFIERKHGGNKWEIMTEEGVMEPFEGDENDVLAHIRGDRNVYGYLYALCYHAMMNKIKDGIRESVEASDIQGFNPMEFLSRENKVPSLPEEK